MEYQIEVKELLIEDNKLTLNIMGTITDSVINAHFVSKPKVILHFINKREDRRIPFVLSNVIHTDGKCYFSGRYTYRLDLLFWKTAKDYLPFDMFLNFSFVDFYEEKIPVDLTPEQKQLSSRMFRCEVQGDHLHFLPDKRAILRSPFRRFVVKLTSKLLK
ncbi:MAG: hypothetical protein IIU98_07835, partial [Ruminococcus sp.]|nr:hypothetical protein [Ruminococcus sp.]